MIQSQQSAPLLSLFLWLVPRLILIVWYHFFAELSLFSWLLSLSSIIVSFVESFTSSFSFFEISPSSSVPYDFSIIFLPLFIKWITRLFNLMRIRESHPPAHSYPFVLDPWNLSPQYVYSILCANIQWPSLD